MRLAHGGNPDGHSRQNAAEHSKHICVEVVSVQQLDVVAAQPVDEASHLRERVGIVKSCKGKGGNVPERQIPNLLAQHSVGIETGEPNIIPTALDQETR